MTNNFRVIKTRTEQLEVAEFLVWVTSVWVLMEMINSQEQWAVTIIPPFFQGEIKEPINTWEHLDNQIVTKVSNILSMVLHCRASLT